MPPVRQSVNLSYVYIHYFCLLCMYFPYRKSSLLFFTLQRFSAYLAVSVDVQGVK